MTIDNASELADRLQQLRNAQRAEPMPDWTTRATRLRALETLLSDNREQIVEAIHADFGCRPREETELL